MAAPKRDETFDIGVSKEYKYGFHDDIKPVFKSRKGLDTDVINQISDLKNEPDWMRQYRLKAYEIFKQKPDVKWGGDLSGLNFDDIYYYVRASDRAERSWDEVPEEIKRTFDRLGIPEAERKFLAGVGAQYDSEVVYHNIQAELDKIGVVFVDTDTAVREYPDLVKEYFGAIIPAADNKFAALNTAVWSGGSFIYVPPGIKVDYPLQAYFRINSENMGQFERTLIIADEGAQVHYVEGCLPAGEQVSTGERWINIESIKPGDLVVDSNGNETEVQAIRTHNFQGELVDIYPISPENHFRLTPEHPVLSVKRKEALTKRKPRGHWIPDVDTSALLNAEPMFSPAGELSVGDFIIFPVNKVVRDRYEYTTERLRLLGYYLAEGSAYIHKTLNMPVVTFTFGKGEREYIDEVKALVEHVVGKATYEVEYKDRDAVNLMVYSQALMELCVRECGKGAADKRLSKEIMELPHEKQAQLLETYYNGDGNVCKQGNCTRERTSTASKTLARQLQELLARQGIYASISVRKGGEDTIQGRRMQRNDQYVLVYTKDKKHSQVRFNGDYFLVPIKKLERVPYDGPVFNFEVSHEPNAYLVRGFAVHNCTAPIYTTDSLHSAVVEIICKKSSRVRYTTIQNWSNNVYNLVTKRAVAQEDAHMEWIDGNLGCLAEGSAVTTPTGVKRIEDLMVGERVLSLDESTGELCFRPVTAKRFSGYQSVHEVSYGERRLLATSNHPFYSYRYMPERAKKLGRYRLDYVRADELTEAIIPRTSIEYGQPHKLAKVEVETRFTSSNQYTSSFEAVRVRQRRLAAAKQTTTDLMWLFGLFLGDGNIYRMPRVNGGTRYAKVGFSTPRHDRARQKLLAVMSALTDAEPTERVDGIHLTWNSVELADFFEQNGFTGNARTKRLPEWVFSIPESQRLALLAGYIDSDGCVVQKRRKFSITSVNSHLLQDIARLATTLGITARMYTESDEEREVVIVGNPCTSHGSHRISIPLDGRVLSYVTVEVADKMRTTPLAKLQHRRQIGRSQIKLPDPLEVAKVSVSEPSTVKVPTWDIEVAGTGNFVSEGFIVHNSKLTMKYPSVYMRGRGARGEILSIAFAGKGQHQDAGGKVIHCAPDTTSRITSKSISKDGGRASYRGELKVIKGAKNCKSNVVCDALILDEKSRSDTYPVIQIDEDNVNIGHEARVSKIGEEQLFYLMSRGLSEEEASTMIVNGFIEPLVKELPMEYAVEMNRLIQLQMEGSVG
jgi:Fe-S cluster assembly protein SufB